MDTVVGPDGPIETLVTGSGAPTTLFAHGLAGSIAETRPFGSGVTGTKVYFHFRGHGATRGSGEPWTYDGVASELCAVASAYRTDRALGVSMGAGALLRVAVTRPHAFERLVLVLPAVIDQPRVGPAVERMRRQADLVETGELETLAASIVDDQPAVVRGRADVQVWARRRAQRLAGTTVARALRELSTGHPLTVRDGLRQLDIPVLVIAQVDDDAHPASVAHDLAGLLPRAELAVFGRGGVMWSHRAAVRELISGFLNT